MSGIQSLFRTSLIAASVAGLIACHEPSSGTSAAEAVPYYNTPDFTPVWLTNPAEVDQKITHHIADFSFRNQENQEITQKTVAGKLYIANFFFTACPTVCPKMTSLLKAVQDTFQADNRVALLSFSVTPWLDSVPRLHRYAASKGVISGKWHLLTGQRGQIYELARKSYFAEDAIGFTKDSTEFLHTEHLILVDQNRRIRGVYNGTQPLEIDKLILDIRALLPD
ncbi:SCO family protein [uncultured Fibrella sp.]|uniref:SCO family protein n=1 Tax=uncultured Fibrella sp. TaxID=1284596 RepID=UPI0035C976FB